MKNGIGSVAPFSCDDCLPNRELGLLFNISRLMAEVGPIEQRLEKSLRLLQQYLHLERCVIYTIDEGERELRIFASHGLTRTQEVMATFKIGEGATGVAAKSREPVVVENVHNNMLFLNKTGARSMHDISYVAVPMIMQDTVLGVLSANLTKDSRITFDETIKILTIVSSIFSQFKYSQRVIDEQQTRLDSQNTYYKQEIMGDREFDKIVGDSDQIQQVFHTIGKIAPSKATVLVRGETGTGKELVASAIHNLSHRKNGPFIKLNCAAIAESLLESELFGHEKGAFTDAVGQRKGRFELADGGTLFLDEIGDISSALQVKLLRVLQEQEFERIGGSKTIQVDVRIVAATNRDLEKMVADGKFREDLFYRLNVIPIQLPPLRSRGGDVILLAEHFLEKFNKMHHCNVQFSVEEKETLLGYDWPGNIRELENTMERIVLLSENGRVDQGVLHSLLPTRSKESGVRAVKSMPTGLTTKEELEEIEKQAIIKALQECNFVKIKAAKKLGISNRQIGYKIKKYGIKT